MQTCEGRKASHRLSHFHCQSLSATQRVDSRLMVQARLFHFLSSCHISYSSGERRTRAKVARTGCLPSRRSVRMAREISLEKILDDNEANRRTRGKENGTIIKGSIYELSLIKSLNGTSRCTIRAQGERMRRIDSWRETTNKRLPTLARSNFSNSIEYDLSRRSSRGGTS